MHHSLDPIKTLNEVRRVLKPNGRLIFVDRAHNNKTPKEEIERMLNVIYSEEFIESNFMPKGTILSRKQNGEHEYRFKEWEYFIHQSGFEIVYKQLFLEKHKRNENYKNDAKVIQKFISFELGGFEKERLFIY